MMQSTLARRAIPWMLGLFTLALIGCGQEPPPLVLIEGRTMGTTYSIKVADAVDQQILAENVEARLIEVNDLMSTYIPSSEISRLNQLPVGESMGLSAENRQMLSLAKRLHEQSRGKFDVTLGPLIELWGFGADPSRRDVPPEKKI